MYGVIRRFNVIAGNTHRVLTKIQNGYALEVASRPGFISYHIIDAGDDTLVSSSVFESRAHAEEAGHHAAEWVKLHIARMLRIAPVIFTGEIKVHTARPGGPGAALAGLEGARPRAATAPPAS